MSWTAPRDWVDEELITHTIMNAHVRDNLRYLKGLDGVVTTESGLIIDNTGGDEYLLLPSLTTAERNALTAVNGMLIYNETTAALNAYEDGAWAAAGVKDHGALLGLADDDHTQYLLINGTRAMTGAFTSGTDGSGYDMLLYGGTASNSLTYDASENVLNILSTMKAADNVIEVLVTDATTLSSGRGRALHLGYTVSGTKTGTYGVRTANIETTVSENVDSVCGINIYQATISDKTVGNLFGASIYMSDQGNAVSNLIALDVGINSTNVASSRHTGMRIRNHSGTATAAITIEEAFTNTILRHSPSGIDLNLITLDNSSGAIFYWDDSEIKFRFNKGLYIDAACTVQGTWTTSGAWTLPAFIAGGNISLYSGADLYVYSDAGSTVKAHIDGATGHIGVGGASSTSRGIIHEETFEIGDNFSRYGISIDIDAYHASETFSGTLHGIDFNAYVDGSLNTQNWTGAVGVRGVNGIVGTFSGASATKTITGMASIYVRVDIDAAGANDLLITNYYGLYVSATSLVGYSKLTNDYGIYIGAQAGGSTLNYAIYTAGGSVYHVGDLTAANIITAGNVDGIDVSAHDVATTGVHGISGTIVGTSESQALTNKSYNGLTLTSTTGTFTLASGKTFTVNNTLTLTATDTATLAIGGGGTLGTAAYTASTDYVAKSTFDAHTILIAISDDSPVKLDVAASRMIGRAAAGNIVALAKADILTIINVTEAADVTGSNTCDTPGGASTDTTAIHDDAANEITAITLKGTPVAADEVVLEDSAASYVKKSATVATLGAGIKLDALATPDDVTTLNSSTNEHGLLKKLDNTATNYMDGTGAWSVPAGAGGAHESTHVSGGADEIDSALSLAAIPDTLTGKDADTLDGFEADELISLLTVPIFQANAATGTATVPAQSNDNNTATATIFDAINEYIEVAFDFPYAIKQFRLYGLDVHTGDGRWKVQYWDGAAWQDWETAIPVTTVNDWSSWVTPAAGAKITQKIRLVCTTVDTGGFDSRCYEMELKY